MQVVIFWKLHSSYIIVGASEQSFQAMFNAAGAGGAGSSQRGLDVLLLLFRRTPLPSGPRLSMS